MMNIDIQLEARNIICEHTEAFMSAVFYEPENPDQLWKTMLENCAYILTTHLIEGKYTPMQYNAIRNEIAKILDEIFRGITE